jgi:hypothetical protein
LPREKITSYQLAKFPVLPEWHNERTPKAIIQLIFAIYKLKY